ncbi:MAG: hypothetical protein RL026_946 [Pseudomonadota bacterium]|jgi:cation diffusion facilitator family transporter
MQAKRNNAAVEALSLVGLATTFVGLVAGIVVVLNSNSLALVADLCNALLEFTADLLAYLTFRLLRSQRFAALEYGLGKFENVASLFIGLLMLLSTLLLGGMALQRLSEPVDVGGDGLWLGLATAAVMSVLNARLWWQANGHHQRDPSPLVDAQRRLFASKSLMDGIVFASTLVTVTMAFPGVHYVDTAASLVIGGFMLTHAWRMIRHSLKDLVDHSISEPLQAVINQQLALHFDAYAGLDGVRSRCAGGDVFIEIFLSFEARTPIGDIQGVLDGLRQGVEQHIRNARVTVVARSQPRPGG